MDLTKKIYSSTTDFYTDYGFIVVDNYDSLNKVVNYHFKDLKDASLKNCIGVWKIKQLKQ